MRIHVVYIITKLELGGAQKVCLSLFKELSKNPDIQTHLISGNEGLLLQEVQDSANVVLLPSFKREIGFGLLGKELLTLWQLTSALRVLKKQYGHLIVHTHSTKAGLLGRWAAFFARIPQRVHTIHGYGFHAHQSWCAWLPTYVLELVTSFITTHFICVSSTDVRQGNRLFPFFSRKVSIIRAAVDDMQFMPATLLDHGEQKFIIGTIGCLKPQKNLEDLIRAFAAVYQQIPIAHLEIIGDGVMRAQLECLAQQLGIKHAVTFLGWQKQVTLPMRRWQLFAMSSLWEGLPCAIVEARMLKLPVVAYDTGGIADIIKHGKNGLLYPQKQWQLLGEGMMMLAQDHRLYQQCKNYKDDLTPFFTTTMLTQHYQLYHTLVH